MTQDTRSAAPYVRTATETAREGQDTRERVSEPLRLNPNTSLSMTYLRAYIDWAHSQRNHVRKRRRAEHQLRMHTAHCTGREAE